ncbi:IclR family transcriptional regulator [Halomicrococcus gelatinilyticus]|uniref:IclR family transcriptional regulator n=1 Tax=Halomicrococcus gelatinilyticus TaxID=1702103 RepID=UPI002E0F175B
MSEDAKHPVKATEKTLAIVEALKEEDGGRVTPLAESLDMSKSVVHNHLATLRKHGYVDRDGDEYRLGMKFLDLGGYLRHNMKLYRVAKPEVDKMAEETGELANLLTEDNGCGVYLYRVKGEQAVDLDTYVGRRTNLHYTAQGKAILAHLPEERLEQVIEEKGLPKATNNTITDREALDQALADIRERGYAYHEEERLKGLRSIAAPIVTDDGTVHGSISISGPANRMRGETVESEIPRLVRSTSNAIELNLNYTDI